MASFLLTAVVLQVTVLLVSCGGGSSGGTNPTPPPPPSPDFSIAVKQASVSLQQQGAYQSQSITAEPTNGFTGTISLTVSGLPADVTMTPGTISSVVITGSSQSSAFQLAASQAAAVGTSTITVTGTSGSISHSVTFSLAVTAAAPFTIQMSPTAITMTPSSYATVQVSVTANPGTSPSLAVQLGPLPSDGGIGENAVQGFVTPTNPGSFTLETEAVAQPVQNYPIVVTATDSANNSYVVVVPLTVLVPSSNTTPTRSTFARTDQSPTGVVYDEARKLLFVSVEALNQVAVLSSVDGHRVATIPVQDPTGIDEAVDGSAVYVVSPYFTYITTIDPNLLQVVQQTNIPQISGPGQAAGEAMQTTASQVATLSNGNVLVNIGNSNNSAGGPPTYLWNPTTNVFTGLGSGSLFGNGFSINRSANHSKVLFCGISGYLYDAGSGNLSGPLNSGCTWGTSAISPDGSQFVILGSNISPTVFYDDQGNVLASMPILDTLGLGDSGWGVLYSLDGSRLYIFYTEPAYESELYDGAGLGAVTVIDTNTFSYVGSVPNLGFGITLPGIFSGQTPFAIDETNMIFGGSFLGMGYLDASSPGWLSLPLPSEELMSTTLVSLKAPTAVQLQGSDFSSAANYSVYFGPSPASPQTLAGTNVSVQSTSVLDVTVPAGTVTGPVNMTFTRSDGYFNVRPDAVSYGPTVLQVDTNAGSPSGGDSIKVVGYGFDGSNVQVTVGGNPATNVSLAKPSSDMLLPREVLTLTTPAGAPGNADVTVTTPDGSTTVSGGFQYLTSVQLYPIQGALDDIVYDQARQRLYITNQNNNRVEIFDLGSNTFLSPVQVGNEPTALALTPDGVLLGVINSADVTVSVIDPVALKVIATFTVVSSQDTACNVPLTMSPAEPHRMLLNLKCPSSLSAGLSHLVNLDTGSLDCTGVAGCQSNGTDLQLGLTASVSTPDGSKIFLAPNGASAGDAAMLDLNANTLTYGIWTQSTDVAVDADGNAFASNNPYQGLVGILNTQLSQTSIMAFEPYADSDNQSLGLSPSGEKLNASGSLLYMPQNAAVAIFDVHTGRMVRRLPISDGIPKDTGAMALDETGTKMFLISNSGITIAQLSQVPLSLASVNPATGSQGTQVTLRGSGFLNGATVSFGTEQASTTYVDPETLTVTAPAVSSGPVRITVNNPDGSTYSLDAVFTVQ
jgi:DNA-binding beta-propeller fold protein YncE